MRDNVPEKPNPEGYVRYLTEFPRVHGHSINAAVDIVSRQAGPDMAHGPATATQYYI